MATAELLPVSEYHETAYCPDREYVNGEGAERGRTAAHPNQDYSGVYFFRNNRKEWQVVAMGDQRVQVKLERYRVPDICIVRSTDPVEDIVQVAPLICVEILSKDDSLSSLQERVDDFLNMGVPNVWVVDPWKRLAYVATNAI